MEQLIADLEAATEGSRALDMKICLAITGLSFGKEFTTSLDAAMTLVPEGMDVDLYVAAHASKASACAVHILHPETEERLGSGSNLSTALALCIAALKARQAMAGDP